jgi:hypothetical protein
LDQNGEQAKHDTAAGATAMGLPYFGTYAKSRGLLANYPAVIDGTGTIFSQGHSGVKVKVMPEDLGLEGAHVQLPNFTNPWAACADGTAACKPPTLDQRVPFAPSQPGIGFKFPFNGSSDIFVQTAQLDFSGVLETYVIDYVPWVDPLKPSCETDNKCNTGFMCNQNACQACTVDNPGDAPNCSIRVEAIESRDFLGEVFVCQDPATSDILHVGMYTGVHQILEWLAHHPGNNLVPSAQDYCGIIVRYSPYDNYPDFITSLTYGVDLATNQGMGFGRIVDATLFDTTLETLQ